MERRWSSSRDESCRGSKRWEGSGEGFFSEPKSGGFSTPGSPIVAGGLLLHRSEQKTGILRQFARCFLDDRQPERIDHSVPELVRQRVYGLALGYEELNDHDQLRGDPLLAMLSGKADVEGRKRRRKRDRGKAGAGKSTLNRLEVTPPEADAKSRYKKIVLDTAAVDDTLVNLYIQR